LGQVATEVKKIGHLINELVVMTCDADVHEVVKRCFVAQKLRQTDDAAALYAILTTETASRAA
jgi:hypothetical protein